MYLRGYRRAILLISLIHSKESILYLAAQHGSLYISKLLIEKGANPELADCNGVTPLIGASYLNQLQAVEFLCSCKVNINARRIYEKNRAYNSCQTRSLSSCRMSGQSWSRDYATKIFITKRRGITQAD